MAYTIKVHTANIREAYSARSALLMAIERDGRFTVQSVGAPEYMHLGSREGSRKSGFGWIMKGIRLSQAKPYCGQHPGECVAGGPRMKAKYLEWDDWVAFHELVNEVLGAIDADVFTRPQDVRGIMWIRKGTRRRERYDYYEVGHPNLFGIQRREWNRGTDDQFAEVCLEP